MINELVQPVRCLFDKVCDINHLKDVLAPVVCLQVVYTGNKQTYNQKFSLLNRWKNNGAEINFSTILWYIDGAGSREIGQSSKSTLPDTTSVLAFAASVFLGTAIKHVEWSLRGGSFNCVSAVCVGFWSGVPSSHLWWSFYKLYVNMNMFTLSTEIHS